MQDTDEFALPEQRVLIFSAQTPQVWNRQIYFLFSQHQLAEAARRLAALEAAGNPAR